MIANAIERVLNGDSDLQVCIDGPEGPNATDPEMINELVVEGKNMTCGDVKVEIAISIAFVSGFIMVSGTGLR